MSAIPFAPIPGGETESGPRARILVVDDRVTSREIVKVALGSLKFEVHEAGGGFEALEQLERHDFDLVLLDVMMPDLNGLEVLKAIRETHSGSERPVIMLTVKDRSDDVVQALKLGANDYVAKPLDIPALVARIETQLLRKQAEDVLREARDHLEQRVKERTVALRAMNQALHDEIQEREGIERKLRESEQRYRVLYDENPSMIYTVSRGGAVVSVNDFGAGQLGFAVDELVGLRLVNLHPDAERLAGAARLEACWENPEIVHRWETRQLRKDGSSLWARVSARVVEQEGESNLFMVCEDITEAYNLSQQLSYQASHDPLTGLVNRREFEQRLGRVLDTARNDPGEHALCYLDLDQFKVINDTCGHVAGDELLRQLSGVLQANVRRRDTLARLGGDEFGVLVEHCSLVQAQRVANSLRSAIEHFRFRWQEKTFTLGVSIGLVPITESSDSIADIMSAADNACYVAKDGGRNRIHVFRADDEQLVRRHGEMQWVVQIQRALDEGRFFLCYQPIARLADRRGGGAGWANGTIDRYELLLRMRDDDGRVVAPGAFLPAAERYNLSTKIDRWVVGAAFEWLARHPVHLRRLQLCSINLSGHSMGDEKFLSFVDDQFRVTGISPEKICFEITETAAITNLGSASRFIKVLKERGCRFALDDFGSGVSSFAYLKSLPVDTLKIDGVFVKDILEDPLDLAMVTSFNEIGRVMGKQIIAEFAENRAILDKLAEIGVDFVQGYGVGRPRPLSELARE